MLLPGATRRSIVSGDVKDRRRVVRLLHKGQPLEPQDRAIAQAQVDGCRRQRWVIWLVIPLGIAWVALALVDHGPQAVVNLALGLLLLLFVFALRGSAQRIERKAAAQGITPKPTSKPPRS